MAANEIRLGELAQTVGVRDAVHIAVVTMKANKTLKPGQHVDAQGDPGGHCVGIVDPYLRKPVQPGETFYLNLYPNTVTSLRHEWTHPEFEIDEEKKMAKEWLTVFAEEIGLTYGELVSIATSSVHGGEAHCFNYDTPSVVYENKEKMWEYLKIAEGIDVGDSDPYIFRCAC